MNEALAASYERCRAATREASSNFGFTFLLLPAEKRRAMCALYAFLRHTDDLADAELPGDEAEILAEKRRRLLAWRESLTAALAGDYEHDLFPALHDVVTRYTIDPAHLFAPIEGALLDLERTRYETFDQLDHYCDLVASSVGLACMSIWGYRDEAARTQAHEPALACGRAFQYTNILRDVGEDAARGRIYLPAEILEARGVSEAELLAENQNLQNDSRIRTLISEVAVRAENHYGRACELWPLLSKEGRRVLTAMLGTYHALLLRITSEPGSAFGPTVRLSRLHKLGIATAALLGYRPRPQSRRVMNRPPLGQQGFSGDPTETASH